MSDAELRRHPRTVVGCAGRVVVAGAACDVRVRDVSASGCFVDGRDLSGARSLARSVALGARVVVDVGGVRVDGRVVRVRHGGKDRGRPVARGLAVEFLTHSEAALARLLAAAAT